MKRIQLFSIIILAILFTACSGADKPSPDRSKTIATAAANASASMLEVIDFHSTRRCTRCQMIEANTLHTLDTYFGDELISGKISLRIINVDEEKNFEIAERFEAIGTSLFLNLIKDGKETHIDLTNFAFKNWENQDVFSKELKSKISAELKKI